MNNRTVLPALLSISFIAAPLYSQDRTYDVVIYGGTSAGVAAAVQAKRMGKQVLLIEPGDRLGGLTSGGLGQTDIGNKAAIGGISREFYREVRRHYSEPSAWIWQSADQYRGGGQSATGAQEDTMWTFEPSVARKIFDNWVGQYQIETRFDQRLDRGAGGVTLTRSVPWRIVAIRMESGQTYRGKMFLDCTYEGDLLAAARTSVTRSVARRMQQYGETLNGVQVAQSRHHQFDAGSRSLRRTGRSRQRAACRIIDPDGTRRGGQGDHRVQAYCFRMCLTDHPENRIPFAKPEGYDERWYELLLRNFEAGETGMPWINSDMPNRKTDTNNRLGFSTDFIGQNYDYPEASYAAARARSLPRHLRISARADVDAGQSSAGAGARSGTRSRAGECARTSSARADGWQQQLYVREARRMVSDYVMTQHHCQGNGRSDDPVGLAAYTMDSHNVQRYVDADGHVRNEGDVEVGGFPPYPISYRSIVPKASECANLLVPVCLSATHIAFGSIRMEPVFMVLGQSAATAAAQAIDQGVAVQEIEYDLLRRRLLDDGQVLVWTGPKKSPPKPGLDPAKLSGIVIDEEDANLHGFSMAGTTVYPYVHLGYRHDGNTEKGHQSATFTFRVREPGNYEVRVGYSAHQNRASNVPIRLSHAEGETKIMINQRRRRQDRSAVRTDRQLPPRSRHGLYADGFQRGHRRPRDRGRDSNQLARKVVTAATDGDHC